MKFLFLSLLVFSISVFADKNAEVSGLIKDLGAAEFKIRKSAKQKLISIGPSAIKQLQEALKSSSDPEVIANLKEVLRKLDNFQGLVAGTWRGQWVSDNSPGYLFEYEMTLKMDEEFNVSGEIKWTQLKSPSKTKDGKSAVEHIKGTGNKEKRMIEVKGFKKDDPENVISLDEYKITFEESGKGFKGITSSSGSWKGIITGKKVKEE